MNDTIIFDGREFAKKKTKGLIRIVKEIRNVGETKKMVAIMIGDNPESELYLKLKEKKAKQIGIGFELVRFSRENPDEIIKFIKQKNNDSKVNGIMVELPIPEKLGIMNYELRIKDAIDVQKDIDCLTSENSRLLEEGRPRFVPPTARAVGEILDTEIRRRKLEVRKRKLVVVGSRGVVGKELLAYFKGQEGKEGLEVIGIDKETKDISLVTKEADILISATGVGHLIKKEMVKPGSIVIDVGIEKQSDGSLIGDVDFDNVKEIASFITPVPGGVGPVTIICLMENLLQSVYH